MNQIKDSGRNVLLEYEMRIKISIKTDKSIYYSYT